MKSFQDEIDLVYLWVDGNDPVWQKKHNECIGSHEKTSSVNCKGRYANNDELKYSLRSIEKYAPWIHRIYIITDSQTPEWLNTDNPKVKIVDHTEILPQECLPCFNSTVLEHFIHKIPGLAEHFLYSNDDMFLNMPVTPDTFFTKDGLPIMRLNRRPLRKFLIWYKVKMLGKKLGNYNQIIQNACDIFEKKYGKYYGGKIHHNIDCYRKSDYEKTVEIFREELAPTFKNHVRSTNDIHRSLVTYVTLAEKRGILKYVTQKTSFRFHIDNHKHYEKLKRYNPIFFCMNDSEFATDEDRILAGKFMAERFPEKSTFEK